ncbi:DUF3426 domain-containing protein [Oceanobacter sp. 5_MG-2023]|uniref:DUF3426 domain-containing protein n=1 Tax=Oceanobacter sp. 5_MG-2023 TaxID=3062645 RepID=UPI0026E2B26F|nr:DUF3426 domain-containing protein [Oceanobacter sp. 5_MG-2023]MDO6681302.1 DUF3426 domain-containing protein [Oceanobacter sp. 5_MG-2023]
MATHVTRCPHCQTSFRVRDEHLTIAKGNVRCGSCLQIFNAQNHLVSPTDEDALKSTKPNTGTPNVSAPKTAATNTARPRTDQTIAGAAAAAAMAAAAAKPGKDRPNTSKATVTPSGDTSSTPAATPTPAASDTDALGSINLESQQEVSTDELLDSLFGSASNDQENQDDGLEFLDTDKLDGFDNSITLESQSHAQPSHQPDEQHNSQPENEQPDDDDDDDLLIHDDMDQPDDNDAIADDPFADLGLREPEYLDRPAPSSSLDIDDSLIDLDIMGTSPLSYDVSLQEEIEEEDDTDEDDDEAWARALLSDDDNSEPPAEITRELGLSDTSKAAPRQRPPAPNVAAAAAATTTTASSTLNQSKPAISFELAPVQPADSNDHDTPGNSLPPGFGQPSRHQELAGNIHATPLQLDTDKQKRAETGWLIAAMVLLVLLAGQVLYFNFDQWSRSPGTRPLYQTICSVLGCQLPHVQDVRTMSTRNLVVRTHPTIANALIVDTLLLNNSEFEQPFPDLVLIFRDLNENVIASRQFTPAEYLAGEVAGQHSMPGRTPVHIALEILDPGQNAVSYAVQLVDNQ